MQTVPVRSFPHNRQEALRKPSPQGKGAEKPSDEGSFPRPPMDTEKRPHVFPLFTSAVAGVGLNIENMVNSSRGAMACTVLDTHSPMPKEAVEAIAARPDMLKVRVIK